mmetsp:Transcript_7655/g.22790  ORF Transcript_7655/g.22790 Transcript_7655/m.22790 type:complete len:214 (-) Transcript_7655:1005-1646(-)
MATKSGEGRRCLDQSSREWAKAAWAQAGAPDPSGALASKQKPGPEGLRDEAPKAARARAARAAKGEAMAVVRRSVRVEEVRHIAESVAPRRLVEREAEGRGRRRRRRRRGGRCRGDEEGTVSGARAELDGGAVRPARRLRADALLAARGGGPVACPGGGVESQGRGGAGSRGGRPLQAEGAAGRHPGGRAALLARRSGGGRDARARLCAQQRL